jgi:multidrug efflux pump subunit AcrB
VNRKGVTDWCLNHLLVVFVLVSFIITLGLYALSKRPVSLLPELQYPVITVVNSWPGASPEEVESVIVEPQELLLKNLPGVREIKTVINKGRIHINLSYQYGIDLQSALTDVLMALNQAPSLPDDALETRVIPGGAMSQLPISSIQVYQSDPNRKEELDFTSPDIDQVLNQVVKPRLARIPGISQVDMRSHRAKRIEIRIDPHRLALHKITPEDLVEVLADLHNESAGYLDQGSSHLAVRIMNQPAIEQIKNTIIGNSHGRPLFLHEVADVQVAATEQKAVGRRNGKPSYYIAMYGTSDANAVQVNDHVKEVINDLNANSMKELGLAMEISFDASAKIKSAIKLVSSNLAIGMAMALLMLFWFLKDQRAAWVIAMSIPVSFASAFIALTVFGLTINVISLAGLAFSVGMVIDPAMMVQEQISKSINSGKDKKAIILLSAHKIKRAIMTSTFTSVAIFLPILLLDGIAGQLFYDIAITFSVALITSYVVAITLIPALSYKLSSGMIQRVPYESLWLRMAGFISHSQNSVMKSRLWLLSMLLFLVISFVFMVPSMNLLPSAKAHNVLAFLSTPPAVSTAVYRDEISDALVKKLDPYLNHEKQPFINSYNINLTGVNSVMLLYPEDIKRTAELADLLNGPLFKDIPDTRIFASEGSLIRIMNNGYAAFLNIHGSDLDQMNQLANEVIPILQKELPNVQIRNVSGSSRKAPEVNITPKSQKLFSAGLSHGEFNHLIKSLTGGLFVNEYFIDGQRYDLIIKAEPWRNIEELGQIPFYITEMGTMTVADFADISTVQNYEQINRIDGQRAITVQLNPPAELPLEALMNEVKRIISESLEVKLSDGMYFTLQGNVGDLSKTVDSLFLNFVLALGILMVLLLLIYKDLFYAVLVFLLIPLSIASGLLGLQVLNLLVYQALDVLTVIGFVILIGLVVNNGILLIDQFMLTYQSGVSKQAAIKQSLEERIRPIVLSTVTSVVGMLPLMLIPGTGSDIYRGLAAVIVFGMLLNLLFTCFALPSMLNLWATRKRPV